MQSVEQYSRQKRLDLAAAVLAKHRIYLDQKYWIAMREAKYGHPEEPDHTKIYQRLLSLVKSGKAVCPISHVVFEEMISASRYQTRLHQAETIDELCLNVTIQPPKVLDQTELTHFVRLHTIGQDRIYPLDMLVWNYVAHVCGERLPIDESLAPDANEQLQLKFLKYVDQLSLTDMVRRIGDKPFKTLFYDTQDYAKIQTSNQKTYEHEFSSFKEVFLSEIAGILDFQADDIRDMWSYLRREYWTQSKDASEDEIAEAVRQMQNLIYHGYEHERLSRELPGIHICAGIYAAKRYVSKQQRGPYAKKGDIKDHMHARVALPYCHAFFTERRLGLFLTQKPLNYDEAYGCTVLWDNASILNYLNTL